MFPFKIHTHTWDVGFCPVEYSSDGSRLQIGVQGRSQDPQKSQDTVELESLKSFIGILCGDFHAATFLGKWWSNWSNSSGAAFSGLVNLPVRNHCCIWCHAYLGLRTQISIDSSVGEARWPWRDVLGKVKTKASLNFIDDWKKSPIQNSSKRLQQHLNNMQFARQHVWSQNQVVFRQMLMRLWLLKCFFFCLCRGCVWWLNKPLCLVIQPLVQALFVRLLSSHSGGTVVQSLWYVTVNPAVQWSNHCVIDWQPP